jgi:hypothetical protein
VQSPLLASCLSYEEALRWESLFNIDALSQQNQRAQPDFSAVYRSSNPRG